jgi:hypothetical protein
MEPDIGYLMFQGILLAYYLVECQKCALSC